ncbi:hypothetical protein [Streptomyces sp. NPDC048442]|uniref:phage tail protein n=1 Tax=Streptomyces sp. NPDC048442 TaxID=3154823 RepID=UPI00341A2B14
MALRLGELVGVIRADESGWISGLGAARLHMQGLQRDTEGRLRDLNGRFVTAGRTAGRGMGQALTEGSRAAAAGLGVVATAAAGIGAGVPAVAAVSTALGGLAAGAVSAGIAVKAFSLAVKPQMEGVAEASEAAEKADDAHEKVLLKKQMAAKLATKGGKAYESALKEVASASKAAREADAAAEAQMQGLPPATQATARAFAGLKGDYKAWSDSLSDTTMPVLTDGLTLLRSLLPALTPFVEAAAGALRRFIGEIQAGADGGGIQAWAQGMAAAAGPALSNFLAVIRNLAVGFGGLLAAFAPASAGVTGGLVSMTAAFAAWGSSLKGSAGFGQFMELARQGGATLGTLARAALSVIVALAPLIGITTMLAVNLAKVLNALPPGVVNTLAQAVAAIVIGMKLWALYGAVVAGATKIWAAAQWILNSAFLASPITWIVVGIAALIAVIVLIATKTTWFQTAWNWAWNGIKAVVSAAVDGILAAIEWLGQLPGKIGGWVGAAKDGLVRKFVEMVVWVAGLPGRIWGAISGLASTLWRAATTAFERFKVAAITKAAQFIIWARGIPGRIGSAIGNLGRLLLDKGKAVVQGLWEGIKSMGSWIAGKVAGFAKSMIPGPIARVLGIASPSKVTRAQGRWVGRGLVDGLTGTGKQVKAASTRLADIVADSMMPGRARSNALNLIGSRQRQLLTLANRESSLAARMKTASKSYADLIKNRDKLAADVKKGVLDGANITSGTNEETTASSILSTLSARVAQAKQFAANLASLRKKGVSGDLLTQIAQAGVEQGSAAAGALSSASKGQIAELNKQQRLLGTAAGQAGMVAGNAMYGAGIDAASGLIRGLRSQQSAIERQMLVIARGMSTSIKRALGIRSPSRVMASLGQYIPAGLVQGIASGQSAVDRTMAGLVSVPRPGQVGIGAGGSVSGQSGSQSGPSQTTIRIEVAGPDEMKRLIRRIVKTDGRGDVQIAFG